MKTIRLVSTTDNLPYIKTYLDRHGRRRWYFRRGTFRQTLPAPGSVGFLAIYEKAMAECETAQARSAALPTTAAVVFLPGSIGWIVNKFRCSPPKTKKGKPRAASTAEGDRRYFDIICSKIGRAFMRDLNDKNVKALRNVLQDEKYKTSVIDQTLNRLSVLWNYADEYLDLDDMPATNPTVGIKRLHVHNEANENQPWTPDIFAAFDAQAPANLRIAVALLLYTGQRTSDVVNMKWSHYDGDCIEVAAQQKTGEYVIVPCHKALKAVLDQIPRKGEYILTGERKDRLQADSLQIMIRRTLASAGYAGYGAHGLRKNAVQALAEAGASLPQIMAITGHKSPQMALHYMKRAEQKRMARGGMDAWENSGKKVRHSA